MRSPTWACAGPTRRRTNRRIDMRNLLIENV
jgi:hypothetical protein